MSQQIIDIGAAANDGTGEPLRSAFNAVNENFSEVYAAGPVGSNVTISGNTITVSGTNNNLVLAANGIGNIQANSTIIPSIDAVYDIGSPSNRIDTVYAAYFAGNGSQLTGVISTNISNSIVDGDSNVTIPETDGNVVINVDGREVAEVQRLNTVLNANLIPGANTTYDLGSPTAAWQDLYLSNSTIYLANSTIQSNATAFTLTTPTGGTLTLQGNGTVTSYANSNVAAYLPTYTGNVRAGNVSAIGNVTGQYIIGDGGYLSNIVFSGNVAVSQLGNGTTVLKVEGSGGDITTTVNGVSNVQVITPSGVEVTGTLDVAGNVTGNYFVGNGSALTSITGANVSGTVASATTAGTVTTAAQPNITSVGTLSLVSITGNVTGGNLITAGLISSGGQVTGSQFNGSGAGLTNIPGANVSGTVASATTAATVTTAAQPNITSVGTLTSLSSSGNITAPYFIGNGSQLTGLPAAYSNANVESYLPTYTGNLVNLAGNVTTTGNVSGAYVLGNGSALTGMYSNTNVADYLLTYLPTYTGNIGADSIAATGNIAASFFLGNGSQLTGLPTGYSNTLVAAYLPTYTGNLASLQGNVTTTANVSGSYILGNGSQLTGLPESYGNANVAAYLPTYTGNLASLQGNVTTTANVSGSYILGNGSQLTGLPSGYANADVAAYLPTYTGNLTSLQGNVTTTANVSANYVLGNGSALTGMYSNTEVAAYLPTYTGNIGADTISATGNVTGSYFNGNGSQLTGMYSNTEVAAYLPTYTGNLASLQGNVTTTANVSGAYILGNGSQLTGLPESYSNANVAAYLPTYTGNLASLQGNVTTTANVSANYVLGNGSALTGLPEGYANSKVSTYLESGTNSANIVTTANISGAYVLGNGSQLTGVNAVTVDVTDTNGLTTIYYPTFVESRTTAQIARADVDLTYRTDDNLLTVGNINTGTVSATGNITGSYILGNVANLTNNSNTLSMGSTGVLSLGDAGGTYLTLDKFGITANTQMVLSAANASTGNNSSILFDKNGGGISIRLEDNDGPSQVFWSFYQSNITFPDGSQQFSAYANANVAAYLPTYTGNLAALTGNVTTTANISGNYLLGNGALITGLPANYSNSNVSTYLASGTNSANIVTTANISGAYILGNGSQLTGLPESYTNANVAAYLPTYTGNLVALTGNVTTTANISGAYILGNGSQLTGMYSNTDVAAYLPTYSGNLVSLTGAVTTTANITGGNILTAGLITATGNISGGNIVTSGLITATGNVVASGVISANTLSIANTASISGNLSMNSQNITGLADPVAAQDAATKVYVDTLVASGIHFHQPVRVESPINLTATYNNGTAGVGATLTNSGTQVALVIDGVSLNAADRVLIYQQTDQTQNGIYVVSDVGSGATNWVLTRSSDADTYVINSANGLSEGSSVFVQEGTTGAGELYTCNTSGVITFGTTNISFAQISSAQIYSAGTGLTLTGTEFSISNTAVTLGSYGSGDQVATFTVNGQGQLTAAANTAITANAANLTGTVLNSSIVTSSLTSVGTLGSLSVSGNVDAGNVNGNGSGLSAITGANVTGQVANALVAGTVYTNAQPNITSVGTLSSLSVVGNVDVGNVNGNGSGLSAITGANVTGQVANALVAGTVYTAAQPNITSVGTLSSLSVLGNVDAGNVNGNGSGLSSLTGANVTGQVANALVAGTVYTAAQPNITSVGTLSSLNVTANIDAGNVISSGLISAATLSGNGAAISSITGANVTGQVPNALVSGTVYTAAQPNITSVGTLSSLSVTGNITGGNIVTLGLVDAGTLSGNGAALSAITGANVTGQVANALVAGTVYTAAQPNITSVGTLSSLSVAGNVDAGNVNGNGSGLSAITGANVTGQVANALVAGTVYTAAQPNITSVGTLSSLAVTGNTTAGNFVGILNGSGANVTSINATNISSGTLDAARLSGTYTITVSGSATTAGTVTTAAQPNITSVGTLSSLSVTGNTTAGNFVGTLNGSGANVTSIDATNISSGTLAQARLANSAVTLGSTALTLGSTVTIVAGLSSVTSTTFVGDLTGAATTAGTVTTAAQPNITSVGTLSSVTVTANVAGGNITTGGQVVATGNITGGNLITAGLVSVSEIEKTGTNGVGNIGSSSSTFNTVFAKATSAQYADLAEMYCADADYAPGTVLSFGGAQEVTISSTANDSRVAGVVSTNPAHLMNSTLDCDCAVALALTGRVPTLVAGTVRKGDMMVSAGNGHAQACATPAMGTVIGKALEDFDGATGMIEIVVGRI